MDERALVGNGIGCDGITVGKQLHGLCELSFGVSIVMNGGKSLAGAHLMSHFLVEHQPARGIDNVFFLAAAAAEHETYDAHLLALHRGDEAGCRTLYLDSILRMGQAAGFI